MIAAFEGYDYVVAPSGSCAATIAKDYPAMLDRRSRPGRSGREALAARTFEITAFLADVLGVDGGGGRAGGRHLSRQLLGAAQPRGAGAAAAAARRRSTGSSCARWRRREVCCGFGGTFCVKYPEISDVMVGDKTAAIAETGAELVLAGDLGCLMNMAGKASREGRAFRARHVVEVLAGDLATPAIGERG